MNEVSKFLKLLVSKGLVSDKDRHDLASHFSETYEYEYSDDDRWSGKLEMLRFLAAQNKISTLTKNLLAKDKSPHHHELLLICRWLKTPQAKQEWRSNVMENIPATLKILLLHARIKLHD